jgi:hypothetical protein
MEQKAREAGQLACGPNQWTARGERIHAWLAGEPVELSEEERLSAELLLGRATEQRVRIFGEGTEVTHLNEKRLWLRLNGRLVASGRFDRVLYTETLALVQDFKTGFSEPTAAAQSAQMRFLAVLVGLNLPKVTEIVVQIISGPYGVSEARYSVAELVELYRQIEATLASLAAPDAPLRPEPSICRKCPANLICPAIKALVRPTIRTLESPLPDGAAAAKLLDEIAIFEHHFAEVKAFYSNKLAGDPAYKIPGYALLPGPGRREITDWPALRERLIASGLKAEQLDGPRSITELERAVGRCVELGGLSARDRFNQIAEGCVGKKEPAPSLKRISGTPKFKELEAA